MGIHTAEPAAAGERYVGLGVNRAARICAAGHGGQVLVSQTTRELLRDDPLPDVSLRDLGEHQLKDLDEPERLFQIVAPGLDENFPPLKTAAPAPFAGREGELADAATEELARRWGRPGRRTLAIATFSAAAVGVAVGVLLTIGGGSTAGASVKANSVGRIDLSSGKVVSAIPVGASPGGVAVGEGAVWVANTDDNNVSRIDPQTNNLRQTISVGGGPAGVATGAGAVWVTNGLDGTVSRIDPTVSQAVGDPILVGNGPVGIAYGEGAVWVANSVDGTISRIDPAGGHTKTFPAVIGASAVVVGFGRVWVASPSAGLVVAIDPASGTVEDQVQVGGNPDAITVGAGAIWVANRADGTVSRIEPQPSAHVTIAIPVGRAPDALAALDSGVWVANSTDESVMRIDPSTNRVAKTVLLANPPQGLAVSPSAVYVAVRSNGLEHRGGNLRISDAAPDSIDPAHAYSAQAWGILSMTNDGLVGFRRVGGIQGAQLVPDLAVALASPTDGGRTWTFRLRSGVRYSTGRLVRPDDIRTGLERTFEVAPASPGRSFYSNIIGTDRCSSGKNCDLSRGIVTDSVGRTITFHLRAPDGDFLAKLALPFAVAVPSSTPTQLGSHGAPATGPYVIAAYRKNRFLKLTRNPMFRQWSADAQPDGYPDTLTWEFRQTTDSLPEARSVEHGDADIAPSLVSPPLAKQQLNALAVRFPSQLHLNATSTTYYFFLNTRVKPFDDVRVRRAVNYAFDRQALARLLGLSFAPTCQILPPNFPAFRRTCLYGSGGTAGLEHARRLIHSSGKAGTPVTVWDLSPRATDGRFMVSLLRSLGFRAKLKAPSSASGPDAYFSRVLDSRTQAQMGFYGWGADFPSDVGFLPPTFSCASYLPANPQASQNPSEFCDHSVDRLFAQALSAQATNPAAATALWQRAERAILAQAPIVPAYNQQDVSFVSKRVGNFEYNPQWRVLLDQLWIR
jgi:YVTN family beta-propeller protein